MAQGTQRRVRDDRGRDQVRDRGRDPFGQGRRLITIADSGPPNYLVQIGEIELLPKLYHQVRIPAEVIRELSHSSSLSSVREWIASPPEWVEVLPSLHSPLISGLGSGESAALLAAEGLDATILTDDLSAAREAERRGFRKIGTLGILLAAHRSGFVQFEAALAKLAGTNIYLNLTLIEHLRRAASED